MGKITFQDFLTFTPSQEEISLAIAKDDEEQHGFIKMLEENNYRQAIDIQELFKYITTPSSRVFYIVRNHIPQDIYEVIAQYPTKFISVLDRTTSKMTTASPVYKDVSVIFIITKDLLKKLEQDRFSLLEKVGPTYQS